MLKIIGFIGVLLGAAGSAFVAYMGLRDMYDFSPPDTEYGNAKLFLMYGSVFLALFLVTGLLVGRGQWKPVLIIGAVCTLFSGLGLFSIGPFLILGSLTVTVSGLVGALTRK